MLSNGLVYNKILDCLDDCKQMISSAAWMTNTLHAIGEVESRMREPMQLAIVGRGSSSKSTLVNAILGKAGVVETGFGAVTYNVCWLKYGDDSSPITVHYKNGTQENISREKLPEWESHGGAAKLKSEVAYIEVKSSFEMLKTINIIDTPGLDSTHGIDSENTINFLRLVHPDAVVLLFTKSLAGDSLKLIQEFQGAEVGGSFSINPMNALGVLSKVDQNWQFGDERSVIEVSDAANRRTLSSRSDVSKALFRILSVSALLGLASYDVTESDVRDFVSLATLDEGDFVLLFSSVESFIRKDAHIPVSSDRRMQLEAKYTRYGIYLCVKAIQRDATISAGELSQMLRKESGFSAFMELLVSHFGDRASLIKAQRGMMSLSEACNKDRQYASTPERQKQMNQVYARVNSIEEELHELREWSLLLRLYEGKMTVSDNFMREYLLVCGENGHAAIKKLGMQGTASLGEMMDKAKERGRYWRGLFNAKRGYSPLRAEPLGVIAKSYELLYDRLGEQREECEKAKRAMEIFNHYVYGK